MDDRFPLQRRLLALACVFLVSGTSASAGTSWVGKITCSYGSGALKVEIDDNGGVSGGMTNGKINAGRAKGSSISFTFSNLFGNQGTFNGSIMGSTMSGTYTQGANKETCTWQASLTGRSVATGEKKTQDCVSPMTSMTAQGLYCLTIANGCSVPVEAYTRAYHKGKPVDRSYQIAPRKKQRLCQVTENGAKEVYAGYCDAGNRKCKRQK